MEGLEPENDTNRRASLRTNFTVVPSGNVSIGVTTLYADMEHHTPNNSNNVYGVFSSALMSQLRRANADPDLGQVNFYGQPAFATLRENAYQRNFVNSQHFAGATSISFTPTDNFRLDATFGLEFTSDDAVSFRPYGWNVDEFAGSSPDGSREVNEDRSREITADIKGSLRMDHRQHREHVPHRRPGLPSAAPVGGRQRARLPGLQTGDPVRARLRVLLRAVAQG